MLTFHLAFRAAHAAGAAYLQPSLQSPCPLQVYTQLAVVVGPESVEAASIQVDPGTATLTAAASPEVLHYFRLADATVKPLSPAPPPLACHAGDAYIAVTPAGARLAGGEPGGASAAIARFLHLRDYFNADNLAAALLAHLLELSPGRPPNGAGVLVIELR